MNKTPNVGSWMLGFLAVGALLLAPIGSSFEASWAPMPKADKTERTPVSGEKPVDDPDRLTHPTILNMVVGDVVSYGSMTSDGVCVFENVHIKSGRLQFPSQVIIGVFDYDENCVLRLVEKQIGPNPPLLLAFEPGMEVSQMSGADHWTETLSWTGTSDAQTLYTGTKSYIEYFPDGSSVWLTAESGTCNLFHWTWDTVLSCQKTSQQQFGCCVHMEMVGSYEKYDDSKVHDSRAKSYGYGGSGSGACNGDFSGSWDGVNVVQCRGSWT